MPGCQRDFDIQECHRGRLEGLPKKELKALARTNGIPFEKFAVQFGQEVAAHYTMLMYSQMYPFGNVWEDSGNVESLHSGGPMRLFSLCHTGQSFRG